MVVLTHKRRVSRQLVKIPKLPRPLGSGFHGGSDEGFERMLIESPSTGMIMFQMGARFGIFAVKEDLREDIGDSSGA